MTKLENFQKMFDTEGPQWMPFTLDIGAIPGFTQPVLKRLVKEKGSEKPEEYFGYDFRTFSLKSCFGGDDPHRFLGRVNPETTFDEWGIGHWAGGAESTYEKICSPLANVSSVKDVENYPAPVVDKETDLSPVREYKRKGYPVFGYAGSLYEWSWWLRGMEQFMMDLILNPTLVEAINRKVAGFVEELALRSAGSGIDVLCFYDDAGMQRGLQISPQLWRKLFKPSWKKILETIRRRYPDVRCFLHSCGDVSEILQDIVELGFDILHPIQPECMDIKKVRRLFGRDIVVCATISAQRLFPFGSPDEIREEVRRLKKVCEPDRRGILCPSNMIQPETPWENVVAFVAEAKAGREA
jgi:uroporphyrinogen decarboxylase